MITKQIVGYLFLLAPIACIVIALLIGNTKEDDDESLIIKELKRRKQDALWENDLF